MAHRVRIHCFGQLIFWRFQNNCIIETPSLFQAPDSRNLNLAIVSQEQRTEIYSAPWYMSILLLIGPKFARRIYSAQRISAPTLELGLRLNRPRLPWVYHPRAFASKRTVKMSDSESENFDLDNVSNASDSDGYEIPVKKVYFNVFDASYALFTRLLFSERSSCSRKAQGNKGRHSSQKANHCQGASKASSSLWC
jgi:hypothetical protein